MTADAVKRDLERELEAANAELERLVMQASQERKSILDRARKEELKTSIWQQRMKVIELERDYVGELYAKVRHEADQAAVRQDQDEYVRAHQRLVRLRIRYLNAIDLLQKLQADGPDSSARLAGGT